MLANYKKKNFLSFIDFYILEHEKIRFAISI